MTNLATYHQDAATTTAREAQVPNADFSGGMNKGGSNAPGIGIDTDGYNNKLQDWTVEDQAENARDPQNSQHLGGDGLNGGNTASEPLRCVQDSDVNDTLSFIVVATEAAPGAGMGAAGADPVNRSSRTVLVGERVWGTNTVA